ncbi:transposase [Nocardia vinacea]|uniref:Transposase n=1 Tax=Nocardia vinacea TaxID=96468 RepID=A0ABZ1YKP5_9NOCA|nr:RNA-guided endonuclease TnpB family protein [Nocardia vinacea]
MQLRYNFRVYPTPGQQIALARAFGCARVVYNDCLRVRQEAHSAGVKVSDTEIQRRVVTLAKRSPERAWLAEVASVVLVQACRDARAGYRNWFDSLSGKRKGSRLGAPRFRSRKDNRQSIRLTRNGFSLRPSGQLYVAKVGELAVQWSRESPRFLRQAERRLRRAQKALSRKEKGSANRAKARLRVAKAHAKVADTRRDWAHKQSTMIIRDNQAVFVEDLCVKGLARTRMAKSVHDAGWGMFARMLEEKAGRSGRYFAKVDRWFPSTQLCSVCGALSGKKPLHVREWTCPCGTIHDRDLNAAVNILAAGRAERLNACGGTVSPAA